MSVFKELFREIVDYAGLFPPAALPFHEVVANYENYLGSDESWMLARLIVPASRLAELEQQEPFQNSQHIWKISSLVPSVDAAEDGFQQAIKSIEDFNERYPGKAIVDTVEIKAATAELVDETAKHMPDFLNAFLEVPHDEDPDAPIQAIAQGPSNIFAKIRTGGVTSDLIPPPDQVARFIFHCGRHGAGFKATAGLHHPMRGDYRLTYDQDAKLGTMFGFANVFVAAAFAFSQHNDLELLKQILVCDDKDQIVLHDNLLSFNGQTVDAESIKKVRQDKAVSFGSCSFTEPTTELHEIGWSRQVR